VTLVFDVALVISNVICFFYFNFQLLLVDFSSHKIYCMFWRHEAL